jgi:hypothetical protein
MLLNLPPYIWICATLLFATLSRFFTGLGMVPSFMNFFHFPLALGTAVMVGIKGRTHFRTALSIKKGLILLLLLSYLSWVPNRGEYFRPFFTWLVFCEFFLLIYAILRLPADMRKDDFLWSLVLGISFLQFPLAMIQKTTGLLSTRPAGHFDVVQGTFVGMGNAHHTAGGVAAIGALICIARGLAESKFHNRLLWLLSSVTLFIVLFLAEAKQIIAAFFLAVPVFLLRIPSKKFVKRIIIIFILALLILLFLSYIETEGIFRTITDKELISRSVNAKIKGLQIIGDEMITSGLGSWLIGLGPGNSISRVALMAYYAMPDSPIKVLGLQPAPITMKVWAIDYFSQRSAAYTGISSWLGIFGDWGLIGLCIYMWMFWIIWKNFKKCDKWEVFAAKAVLIMTIVLGAVYSWFEEPGYILMAGMVIGLGLRKSESDKEALKAQ